MTETNLDAETTPCIFSTYMLMNIRKKPKLKMHLSDKPCSNEAEMLCKIAGLPHNLSFVQKNYSINSKISSNIAVCMPRHNLSDFVFTFGISHATSQGLIMEIADVFHRFYLDKEACW